MDSKKFIKQADEVYQKALTATIELLKNNGTKRYVASTDFDERIETFNHEWDYVHIGIWAIGLNDDDHICIRALVYDDDCGDFPEDWTDITETEILPTSYPDIYRFVVEHLDSAMDKEAAEEMELEEDQDHKDQ